MKEHRRRLLDWMRRQLIGPAYPEHGERLRGSPLERYPTGVLYPATPGLSGIDPVGDDDDIEDLPVGGDDQIPDKIGKPVPRRRYVPPSSVGFSFFVLGSGDVRLGITASGVTYEVGDKRDEQGRFTKQEYERRPFKEGVEWSGKDAGESRRYPLQTNGILIDVRTRLHGAGRIISVVLANRREPPDIGNRRDEHCLFEARLECEIRNGRLERYPRVDPSLLTLEEQEIELRYRHKPIYAIGHGAAVDWSVEPDRPPRIRSEFMPAVDVPRVTATPSGMDATVFGIEYLAAPGPESWPEALDRLTSFVDVYEQWVMGQRRDTGEMNDDQEHETAVRICKRMDVAIRRMRNGIEFLRDDAVAAEAFRIANRAMLDQMQPREPRSAATEPTRKPTWRPFQLAFLLAAIESTVRETDEFRDLVDLIWFPTGGGKTEAYLGLIAFLIAWRRLRHPGTGGGTTTIMRYTLRLLTRQQFQRAARMICALELLRRRSPEQLGDEPITVGMWVGSAASPNRFSDAKACVQEVISGDGNAAHKLVLRACPWCDEELDAPDGYRATDDEFHYLCRNAACDFGPDGASGEHAPLPCNVIDEALYEQPPTLLIATIDKFARLAWEERASVFFGGTADRGSRRPPELIIQDELHLVAGPLGSVAGLYEAALETVLTLRGVRPKYIASTATTRMAAEQVRGLYGRDVAVFPPSGLCADDSWFARSDPSQPGRLYVGYLAADLDQQHCLAPLAAALLAAPFAVAADQQDRDDLLDAWWTTVVYHGSLRGVGNSHNAYSNEVRVFAARLDSERREAASESNAPTTSGPAERRQSVAQVTSRATAQENAGTFDRLTHGRDQPDCLDAVLATNMISVGIDVDRLASMIINGQPFTTAEYIQASSRIGRADVPGLVFANYYRHQARSLSHYENFRPYHETFYRFVEPTSVTPFTYQVRTRALHAALVTLLRHGSGTLCTNTSAGAFDRDSDEVRTAVDLLTQRCRRAIEDEDAAAATAKHMDRLVAKWHDAAERSRCRKRRLCYEAPDGAADSLLCHFDEPDSGLWRTLSSMRNVEETALLQTND